MTEKDLVHIIDQATTRFKGDMPVLESAIGMLMIGRLFGWKVMYLIHSRSTIKEYEKILGVNIRDVMPDVGRCAKKSVAWTLLQGVTNFWKAVKGEIPNIRTPEITR